VSDSLTLDVHAINELQSLGVPITNDLPKYNYTAVDKSNYGKQMKDIQLSLRR